MRRGVESPWERIRADPRALLDAARHGAARAVPRRLASALARSRRRFVASAAESGIDVFRIHDPLNDLANLQEAAEAIRAAGKELAVGLVHSPGPAGETDVLLERANHLGGARRLARPHPRPGRLARSGAGHASSSSASARRAGCPSVCTARAPAARRSRRARGGAGRRGADRVRALSDRALAPPRLGRGADAVARGSRASTRASISNVSGAARSSWTTRSATCRCRRSRRASPCARPSTACRPGSWPSSTRTSARTASPIGSTRCSTSSPSSGASAAGRRSLRRSARCSARRRFSTCSRRSAGRSSWTSSATSSKGVTARRRREIDPTVRRAVELLGDGARREETPVELDERPRGGRGARVERGGAALARALRRGGRAASALDPEPRRGRRRVGDGPGSSSGEAERIRELIRVVQESGIGEVTIEEGEMRVTVRRSDEAATVPAVAVASTGCRSPQATSRRRSSRRRTTSIRVESPMVGTFYRAPQPGAPSRSSRRATRSSRARRSASSRR